MKSDTTPTDEGGQNIIPAVGDFTGCMEQGEFKYWTATTTGIAFKDETPDEIWRTQTQNLVLMYQALDTKRAQAAFKVADALNWGKEHLGEEWSQVIDTTANELHKSVKTISNWMDIARLVHPSRRRETLTTIEHYKAVTKLDGKEQEEFLRIADEENLSVTELKEKIKERYPGKPRTKSEVTTKPTTAITDMASAKAAATELSNYLTENEEQITEAWKPLLEHFHKLFRRRWQNGKAKR